MFPILRHGIGTFFCLFSVLIGLCTARFKPLQLPGLKGSQKFWLLPRYLLRPPLSLHLSIEPRTNSIISTDKIQGAPEGFELAITFDHTNRTLGGRAFCATLPITMLNISKFPLDEEIEYFDYTIDAQEAIHPPIPDPFISKVSVRKTAYGQQLPFPMTRRDVSDVLGGLGWYIPQVTELEAVKEVLFDFWLFDPKEEFSLRSAKLVAKGKIVRTSQPMYTS